MIATPSWIAAGGVSVDEHGAFGDLAGEIRAMAATLADEDCAA